MEDVSYHRMFMFGFSLVKMLGESLKKFLFKAQILS